MRVCFSQERFARKNEEEELRKAFERLDARGYI
jgi:Ca2+-binding EF-hand superfamily protein